ncbi:SNF2-related protein [Enhygromyxa salina]|uniref:ATP-dependent helicase HepA n=1 Tax=Enhygromyxa salina TaxID=215803 RepID=A0A2S9XPW3_9BACT|nr:SNF2-related protein [Enhygromyxa salina]PRP94896.1 ATP-dependent helicase HepA [Enhygromyxa salina]
MTDTATLDWLRCFLQLGARRAQDGIPSRDVRRQEDTVLRALHTLEDRPGVILADEVGMGKTFEALGLAAAVRHRKPKARIVVVTPGPDLNTKWVEEFARFKQMYDFGGEVQSATSLSGFIRLVREHPIVVSPVTMFQGGKGGGAQTYLLSLFFHWKGLHGRTANAIMARFREGKHERVDVTHERFLGHFGLGDLERHLRSAFHRGKKGEGEGSKGWAGLDDIYEAEGLAGFERPYAVRNALYRARFILAGRLLPAIDLLIVDEAHKLKNSGSLRSQGMRTIFHNGFHKAVFLTATPFQLDIGELREVFGLFSLAKSAPRGLLDEIDALLSKVREYQHAYDAFQTTWTNLEPFVAAEFSRDYDADPERYAPEDESLQIVLAQVKNLRRLKNDVIEPGFRKWMIRSLREDKRQYRDHQPKTLDAKGDSVLPFLIYERLTAEMFRRHRPTHKAAVEINMVSSYAAASGGAIMTTEGTPLPPQAEVYRELLKSVLGHIDASAESHPKLEFGIADALTAAEGGEKTLIFCSRVATLEQLRREIRAAWDQRMLARWQRVYPGATADEIFDRKGEGEDPSRVRGKHTRLQQRFHRAQDSLYLALRERYLRTVVPISGWALVNVGPIAEEANRLLRSVTVASSAASDISYQVAKRCVEQAAVRLWEHAGRPVAAAANPEAIHAILRADFLTLGLDLEKDEFENDSVGDQRPTWTVSESIARLVIGEHGNLWESVTGLLDRLALKLRVRVVEQLSRYLTYRQVPFVPEFLHAAIDHGLSVDPVHSAPSLAFLDQYWTLPEGRHWLELVRSFLEYFIDRDDRQQAMILEGPIRSGSFVRHTKSPEGRDRLREAFNTPLFPMVLVANEVMQEGLDLHRHCRRVVHHDLVWNPAQIEQRIGRIDRLGSKLVRVRSETPDAKLDVLYPVIRGTIDERMFRTVKLREKWLEFLLGAQPQFNEYELHDVEPPELPSRLAESLAIDLGPGPRTLTAAS